VGYRLWFADRRGSSYVELLVLLAFVAFAGLGALTVFRHQVHGTALRQGGCVATLSDCGATQGADGSAVAVAPAPEAADSDAAQGGGPWNWLGRRASNLWGAVQGFFVDGLWGDAKGLWSLITDPWGTIKGLGHLLATIFKASPILPGPLLPNPWFDPAAAEELGEMGSALWQATKEYFTETPDRASGRVVYEVATWVVAPLKIAKVAKAKWFAKAARVEKGVEKATDATKALEVAEDAAKAANKGDDAAKTAAATGVVKAAAKLPGDQLTLTALMDLIEESTSYEDYIRKLTTRYQADNVGSFYAIHGDQTVTASTPQVFATYGKATVAYAPQMYTEILWTEGAETIQFQIVEEANKRLSINGWRFDVNPGTGKAPMNPTPEFLLTPAAVKEMHTPDLIAKTNKYAQVGCLRCHMNVRRRMVEPDNHPRRLQEDPGWVFRDPAQRAEVSEKMKVLFDQFENGPTRNNPIYKWFWEQDQVVARGGKILPEDTFSYQTFTRDLIRVNGNDMLSELRRNPKWPESKMAFAAAVQDAPQADALLKQLRGLDDAALAAEKASVERMHAEANLAWIRKRNDESIAFILAEGKHAKVPEFEANGYLKLNRHSIETIGPRIEEMVVSDADWAKLSEAERATKVRLQDLDVKDMDELHAIVSDPFVAQRTRRRTNSYIALNHMLANKNKSLSHLSASVRGLSAETGNREIDLMDVYADALKKPEGSSINPPDPIDATRKP